MIYVLQLNIVYVITTYKLANWTRALRIVRGNLLQRKTFFYSIASCTYDVHRARPPGGANISQSTNINDYIYNNDKEYCILDILYNLACVFKF